MTTTDFEHHYSLETKNFAVSQSSLVNTVRTLLDNGMCEIKTFEKQTNILKTIEYKTIEDVYHSFDDKPAYTLFNKKGNVMLQIWFNKGEYHRISKDENGNYLPAFIEYYKNGTSYIERWYINGKKMYSKNILECENHPAEVYYSYMTHTPYIEKYIFLNQYHRTNKPAIIEYEPNTTSKVTEEYHQHGFPTPKDNNESNPIKIYYKNGKEYIYQYKTHHDSNKFIFKKFYDNGKLKEQTFINNTNDERITQFFDEDGTQCGYEWYSKNKCIATF